MHLCQQASDIVYNIWDFDYRFGIILLRLEFLRNEFVREADQA
jgi:hypothetical protein